MSLSVIIVAAGRGTRLGGKVPKQYIPLSGRASVRRSAEAFLELPSVTAVQLVIHANDKALYEEAMRGVSDPRLLTPVLGGDSRAASVRRGLESLEPTSPRHVLIHDAARPFVSRELIDNVIATLETEEGACAALPQADALWRSDSGYARSPVPREGLWRAQTPQGFDFGKILAAHQQHDGSGADDVAVAREAGMKVRFVPGSEANYKITTAGDLERAMRDAAELRDSSPGSV